MESGKAFILEAWGRLGGATESNPLEPGRLRPRQRPITPRATKNYPTAGPPITIDEDLGRPVTPRS